MLANVLPGITSYYFYNELLTSLVFKFLFKWEILDYDTISQDLEKSRKMTGILIMFSLLLWDTPGCSDSSRSLRQNDIVTHL